MKTKFSLALNNNLLIQVKRAAKKLDIDEEDLIIKAVKKYLLLSEVKDMRQKLKPLFKKQGFANEQSVFNAVS